MKELSVSKTKKQHDKTSVLSRQLKTITRNMGNFAPARL